MAKSYGNYSFSQVEQERRPRSRFNRSSNHMTTMDANMLIPIFCDEVIPGDTFEMTQTSFCRLATPIKPSMDNAYIDVHWFFVPNRLVWENWERFMGAQDNPDDSTDFLVPQVDAGAASIGEFENSIYDYFGIPEVKTGKLMVNSLMLRAYNLIYNEWFRDQNLQDSVHVELGDTDDAANYSLLRRGKRHDYFTASLPFPQKGEPVGLSLSGDAVLDINGVKNEGPIFGIHEAGGTGHIGSRAGNDMRILGAGHLGAFDESVSNNSNEGQNPDITKPLVYFDWVDPMLEGVANLDSVTAVTINQLRQAFQLQRFLERDARSGTRYIEIIKAHFGVTNPDYRLQRPEYLGMMHEPLKFTTIAQTSDTGSTSTPQGNLAAMAIAAGRKRCFTKSFTEHGHIIGLASVWADQTYQQGLNKMWKRQTRVDFYWPEFAHLGEQSVYNYEIYAQGTSVPSEIDGIDFKDDETFGYQERYAEYRYYPNRISGQFRSTSALSLDVWHYAEEFDSLPLLNSEFIECNSPLKRNSAAQEEPDLICDFYFGLICTRPMPMYGTPGFVDHF